jgi:CDP-paratose 2-epimerase
MPGVARTTAMREGEVVSGADGHVVTGGAGFIGCNLVERLLADGERVVLVDDLSRPGSRTNLDWLTERHGDALTVLEGDVCDGDLVSSALEGAGVVYHLAGQTAVTSSIREPVADFDVNVRGTINVLESARARETPPIVIYASTNKVYGDLEDQRIVEESTRYVLPDLPHGVPESALLDFTSPYACSKGAADQYVLTYAKTYGLPGVVLRQSCVYGPRQMGVEDQGWAAWLVFAGAAGVAATIYGDGKQVRDLLYVDDLVDAYLAAAAAISTTSGRAYNIGGGPAFAVSVWQEFSQILRDLGQIPPEVSFGLARQGDQRVYISDTRRAQTDFGWIASTPPREGLERLCDFLVPAAPALRDLLVGRGA